MKYIISNLLVLVLFSCNTSNDKEAIQNNDTLTIDRSGKSNHDSNLVKQACAIIIRPSADKIDSLKKAFNEDFYTIADDNQFYMAEAIDYLDSIKFETINRESNGIITFQLQNGKKEVRNLNESLWQILLFNGKTAPIEADMTNFKEDCTKYLNLR